MSDNCENCGCGTQSGCGSHNLSEEEIEKRIEEKSKHSRKYSVQYRITLEELECDSEEFIERIKAYNGIVDEVEFTEEELIISYDDRLITPSEISDLVH